MTKYNLDLMNVTNYSQLRPDSSRSYSRSFGGYKRVYISVSNLSTFQTEGEKFMHEKKEVCRVKVVLTHFDNGSRHR